MTRTALVHTQNLVVDYQVGITPYISREIVGPAVTA